MNADVQVFKGLDGVAVDETEICEIVKADDSLFYRGYAIEDLARRATYEEVAYLLIEGELPSANQLAEFRSRIAAASAIPDAVRTVLRQLPAAADPMDVLRTGISVMGSLEPESREYGARDIGIRLLGMGSALLLDWYAFHHGGPGVAAGPSSDGNVAASFLRQLHGVEPDPAHVRAFGASLILYAEHDFNASTFAARIAISTLSDTYSALVTAIGVLRGPLHGGANQKVIEMARSFTSADDAERGMLDAIARKARVTGFGQRAYTTRDPRNALHKEETEKLAQAASNDAQLFEVLDRIETVMMREKRMFANLDFYSGATYHYCGIPDALYPSIFALARIPGLIAHVIEQRKANRLIHPSSRYRGPAPRSWTPLEERS